LHPSTIALASVAVLGSAVLGFVVLSTTAGPTEAVPPDRSEHERLAPRIEALEARLGRLEHTPASATVPDRAAAAPPASTGEFEALRGRVEQLERALAELRAAGRPASAISDADELLAQLERVRAKLAANDPEARRQRIALLERFLELFPDDPRAGELLEDLVGEHLVSEPAQAVAALERWRGSVRIDPWRFDASYANALGFAGRVADADAQYQRIAQRNDYPENARWDARFFGAYLHAQRGGRAEAVRRFEAIVREIEALGSPPHLEPTLGGARSQLEQLRAAEPR
jgi:plasmid stabilization system protein ParE